jgi:hypothetical protein
MFGNAITDGAQTAVGTKGCIVSFDLTAMEPKQVTEVQLQDTVPVVPVLSAVYNVPLDIVTLFGYPEAAAPPDVAWTQQGNVVFVFLKTTAYTYIVTVRIGFGFYRNAQNVGPQSPLLDIPQEAKELCKALELKNMAKLMGIAASFQTENTIRKEKARLGLV